MKFNKVVKYYCLTSTIAAFIFIVDFLLPTKNISQRVQEIVSYRQIRKNFQSSMKYGIITKDDNIPISFDLYSEVNKGDKIIICKTRILGVIKSICFRDINYSPYSIYNFFTHKVCIWCKDIDFISNSTMGGGWALGAVGQN
jgi:hypothetical protein